jgi:hypothetical protein
MIPELPLPAEGEVWVCHAHQMIGSREAAEQHAAKHGCSIERVPDDVAREVRAERQRRSDLFIAGLLLVGRWSTTSQGDER